MPRRSGTGRQTQGRDPCCGGWRPTGSASTQKRPDHDIRFPRRRAVKADSDDRPPPSFPPGWADSCRTGEAAAGRSAAGAKRTARGVSQRERRARRRRGPRQPRCRPELGQGPGGESRRANGVRIGGCAQCEGDRQLVSADRSRAVAVIAAAQVIAQPVVDYLAQLLQSVEHLTGRVAALATQRHACAVARPRRLRRRSVGMRRHGGHSGLCHFVAGTLAAGRS